MAAGTGGGRVLLVDTNVIIEAVRTSTWNALTGAYHVETVKECFEESLRGDRTDPAYTPVTQEDLGRMRCVHAVTAEEVAKYLLDDPLATGMDPGERDLFAHAYSRHLKGDLLWVLSSPDKASIWAAVRIGIHDNLVSLEDVCRDKNVRPKGAFKSHHLGAFLSKYRTEFLLTKGV